MVDCSCVWAGTGRFAEEDVETVVAFKFGTGERVVAATLLGILVRADDDSVTGGKPKIEPLV